MAIAGLAFATSIANTLAALILFCNLRKRIGSLGTVGYLRTSLKAGLASAIMGVIVHFIYNGLYTALGVSKLNNLVSLLVAVMSGALIYFVLCYVLKVDQVRDLMDKVRNRWMRFSTK